MSILKNTAIVEGSFNGMDIDDQSIVEVYTSAIHVEKEADKKVWNDGELAYTIKVSNVDDSEPPSPVENAVFTDTIDPEIAALITEPAPGSVMRDGVSLTPAADPENPAIGEYVYNATTGELLIPLGTITTTTPTEISFRVNKKT